MMTMTISSTIFRVNLFHDTSHYHEDTGVNQRINGQNDDEERIIRDKTGFLSIQTITTYLATASKMTLCFPPTFLSLSLLLLLFFLIHTLIACFLDMTSPSQKLLPLKFKFHCQSNLLSSGFDHQHL